MLKIIANTTTKRRQQVKFDFRIVERWLDARATKFFLCNMNAEEVIPIACGEGYLDVIVRWGKGQKWLVRCYPASRKQTYTPEIGSILGLYRLATVLKAEPLFGYISGEKVELEKAGGRKVNIASTSMDKAA